MNRVLIFIDSRENSIIEYFKQYDCVIQKKMLLYGDFLVSDRVCIEKKTVNDFIQSITDKRLFQQLKLLKENFEKPILIIEGENSLYGTLQPNIIRGALSSITVDLRITFGCRVPYKEFSPSIIKIGFSKFSFNNFNC